MYEKIDARVDKMLEKGLVEEVKALKEMGCTKDQVSMQGLGYKEILEYLEGGCSLDNAVYRIKRDTRHFAKRQMTWFRREKEVVWISREDFEKEGQDELILAHMMQILTDKEVIAHGNGR